MAIKFKNIFQSVQKKKYDILDPRKTEFDVDFADFMAKIEGLEVCNVILQLGIGNGIYSIIEMIDNYPKLLFCTFIFAYAII